LNIVLPDCSSVIFNREFEMPDNPDTLPHLLDKFPALGAFHTALPMVAARIEEDTSDPAQRAQMFCALFNGYYHTWKHRLANPASLAMFLNNCPQWAIQAVVDDQRFGVDPGMIPPPDRKDGLGGSSLVPPLAPA
jgi:hypothetical protein